MHTSKPKNADGPTYRVPAAPSPKVDRVLADADFRQIDRGPERKITFIEPRF